MQPNLPVFGRTLHADYNYSQRPPIDELSMAPASKALWAQVQDIERELTMHKVKVKSLEEQMVNKDMEIRDLHHQLEQARTSAATSTAATKTFAIIEILEAILIDTSAKDVLVLQRVSKTWQAGIGGSPRLQDMLWRRPRTMHTMLEPTIARCDYMGCDYTQDALLRTPYDKLLQKELLRHYRQPTTYNDLVLTDVSYNSLGSLLGIRAHDHHDGGVHGRRGRAAIRLSIPRIKFSQAVVKHDALLSSKTSYWNMYLNQPPAKEVEVRLDSISGDARRRPKCSGQFIVDNTGVTVSHIQQHLQDKCKVLMRKGMADRWEIVLKFPSMLDGEGRRAHLLFLSAKEWESLAC